MSRIAIVVVCLGIMSGAGCDYHTKTTVGEGNTAGQLSERDKIEALIAHVEGLQDAVFIRNGEEADAKKAAEFLRRKWVTVSGVNTAKDFINKVASISSHSGEPYMIRFKDGKEVKSGEYLSAELEKLEQRRR
jgi:hypothetical protein